MNRGFSTLELLIAMTVLVLCFSATILLLPGIQDASVDSELSDESLAIAKELLEREQALARKDFRLVVPWSGTKTLGAIDYSTEVEVESIDFVTKKVIAKVAWGGMFGKSQKTELSTIVSNFQQIVGGDTCYSTLSGNWGSPQITNRLLGASILGDTATNYPLSDLDAYYGNLYAAVRGTSGSQGALSPDSGANTDSPTGTLAWSNASNVGGSDNNRATRAMSGTVATEYLYAHDFDFDIPDGATVLGIRVEIERSRSSGFLSNEIRDNEVKIVRSDGTIGDENKAAGSNWPTSDAYASYGDTTDLWEESWTASDINDTQFGVVLSARGASSGGANRTAQVDHVRITVTYVPQFYVLDIGNPTNPTRVGEMKTASGVTPISSGFNAITVATSTSYGHYAFAAGNSSIGHLQVIDISGADPTLIASYGIPDASSAVASAIAFKDGYAYVGLENNSGGDEFFVIDVHNPSVIPAPLSSFEIGAGINAIQIKDGLAYLATNDSSRELIVLSLEDLAHPTLRGSYNAPGSAPGQGRGIYVVGDTAYLGRYYSSSGPELIALSSESAAPSLLGSLDVGTSGNTMGVYGVIVRDYLAFMLTGNTTANNDGRVRIANVANPAAITLGANVSLPNSGSPTALDCEGGYLYAGSVPVSGGQANKGSISIISAP